MSIVRRTGEVVKCACIDLIIDSKRSQFVVRIHTLKIRFLAIVHAFLRRLILKSTLRSRRPKMLVFLLMVLFAPSSAYEK